MCEQLCKFIIQICITKLIGQFGNIWLLFFGLIHYFIDEFFEQTQFF